MSSLSRDLANLISNVATDDELSTALAAKVDYALAANAQSGTGASAYTFVLADATRLTTATGTSAKTFTIPPQSSVVWLANSIIRVANYGTGNLTIAGGSGVTVTNASKTLAQYESAALIRTASNAWTLVPFSGGVGNADFSNAATGTYSSGGINYKYVKFTASGTLTVTQEGMADVLVAGGGGGGAGSTPDWWAGPCGGAGGLINANVLLPVGSLTVRVGAGGSQGSNGGSPGANGSGGSSGTASGLGSYYVALGGGGTGRGRAGGCCDSAGPGQSGGSGGGGNPGGAAQIPNAGNSGGTEVTTAGGGGAGGAGSGTSRGPGVSSSITGSAVTYCQGGQGTDVAAANTGHGGGSVRAGGSGVVIVRVRV